MRKEHLISGKCPICKKNVIDRSEYYQDKDKNPIIGWPGFEESSKHPDNLCIPCCFLPDKHGLPKKMIFQRIKDCYGKSKKDK